MKAPLVFAISFFLIAAVCSSVCAEPDRQAECQAKLDANDRALVKCLRRLENHFLHYRGTEIKIREFYYDKLWKARRDAMDPFSKKVREAGDREEQRLLEVLSALEKKSLRHSNGFGDTLTAIQHSISDRGKSCPEKTFFDCVSGTFQQVDAIAGQIRTEFDHIFEKEREFRNEVLQTAGGREGLYPEDAVEVPALHADYYWRFEANREAARFAEDQRVRSFVDDIEKTASHNFEGKKCCLECGSKS